MYRSVVAAILLTIGGGAVASSQAPSARPALYTQAQAQRGEAVYRQACTTCHGADLGGAEGGPAVTGEWFDLSWEGRKISELFEVVQKTMPQSSPGSLSATQYADVVAFVLSKAGYPAGSTELPADRSTLDVAYQAAKP